MTAKKGTFVISLDFELYWGVRDKRSLEEYRDNLLGVRTVVPSLLELFHSYGTHATWATVGFLFLNGRDEFVRYLPKVQPGYLNEKLSPYKSMDSLGADENEDPYHFAPSLIRTIKRYPDQEIASHTYSHYYCLEKGQNKESFREDLKQAIDVAREHGVELNNLVFPRNQVNPDYLAICAEKGIKSYRGNHASWIFRAKNEENETFFRRLIRVADAYCNLTGHNTYDIGQIIHSGNPMSIPASRFLRPYSKKLRAFEPIRLRRILADMTFAAKKHQVYHLWWHPHNFGIHQEENLAVLKRILEHFSVLKARYGMESLNMGELAEMVRSEVKE